MQQEFIENKLSGKIIDSAFQIHKMLGPGLLESVYESALTHDLIQSGLQVGVQVPVPMVYKDVKLPVGFRVDLMVENKVLIEIKSIENLAPVHFAQVLTYLKLTDLKLGLLINFNNKYLKDGLHRVVNKL